MTEVDDLDLVKITHYINPHAFWYKYESSFLHNRKLFELENELQQYFFDQKMSPMSQYKPQVDEVVAAFHFSFNRWIRAKCDFICEYTMSKTKYVLWAVDYGIPFQTESRWIRKLPVQLKEKPQDSVYFGGIIHIVPAEKAFNYDNFQGEIRPCFSWSPLAVQTIDELINDAAQIRFLREKVFVRNNERQLFGNLVITTHTNKTIGADVILIELNQARKAPDFFAILPQIGTNRVPRWRSNNGNVSFTKYNANTFSGQFKYDPKSKDSAEMKIQMDDCLDMAIEKVTDWEKRNLQSHFGEDITIDDISFNDSASVQVKTNRGRWISDDKIGVKIYDDTEEDQHLMVAGTSRLKLKEKYQKHVPRLPAEREDNFNSSYSKVKPKSNEVKLQTNKEKEPQLELKQEKEKSSPADSSLPFDDNCKGNNSIENESPAKSMVSSGSIGENPNVVNILMHRLGKRRPTKLSTDVTKSINLEQKISEPETPEPKTSELKTRDPNTRYSKTPEPKTRDPKTPESKIPHSKSAEPKTPDPVPKNLVPQNAMPAGFDLRNLQSTKDAVNNQHFHYNKSTLPANVYESNSKKNTSPANIYESNSKKSIGHQRNMPNNTFSLNNVEEKWRNNVSKQLALVHGKHIAKPISNLASANFCEEVHRELEHMRLTQIYRIQSYTWPHLMRGNSVIVISSPRTGKTMSYLPAICSLIKMKSDEDLVPNTVGPIGIIVAPSAVEVEKIAKLCRRLLSSSSTKMSIVEAYGIRNTEKTTSRLLNGCQILVTTPSSLTRLFSNKLQLFDSKRVEHLVLDNVDLINEAMKCELHEILRKCCGLTKNNATTRVQLIVTAKYWNPILSGLLKICHNPELCIGAYIEATVYARSLINIKFINNNLKAQEITDFIKEHSYLSERLIIICNKDDEVDDIVSALKSLSCFFIACSSRSTATEIELTREWHIRPSGDMSILVCTDDVLPELQVRSAQNIIHYSLPLSWTKFSFRFSSLFEYFEDFVKCDVMHKPPAVCLVLLDEHNNAQLPKLIQFLQIHNVENVSKEIYELCNKIKIERESERITENKEFCPFYMEFGKCANIDDCKFRHVLTKFDVPEEHFPCDGSIKFEVLDVKSPTYYIVRLLAHKPKNDKIWRTIKNSDEYVTFNIQFSLYFMQVDNHQTHWPIEVSDMCVVIHMNKYYRCRVLTVSKRNSFASESNVRVKLVDNGQYIMCKSSRLLNLPKEFQDYPYQAVNVRLMGIVPYDHEAEWDTNAIRTIKQWLEKYMTENMHIEGKLKMSLMDTIWVDNIYLTQMLPSIDTYVNIINIKKTLLEKQFASISSEAEEVLKEMASVCGILKDFNRAFSESPHNRDKKEERYISCNQKLTGNVGSVCSSVSSTSSPHNTQNDITKLTTSISSTIKSGNSNGKISTKESTKIELQNEKKHVKAKGTVLKRELWENLVENRFCRVSVGTFYSPNNFYVQHLANLERLEVLYNEIDQFVATNRWVVEDPKIGLNCLAKYEDKYNRAKIMKVLCDGESNELNVSLFFCDIGISENASLSEVLHSSNYLVNILPFQAIRCKMVGVIPNTYGVWTEEICNRIYDEVIDHAHFLYAHPISFVKPIKQSDLQYWRCDVLLLDCSSAVDIKINHKIVEKGLAQYDPESKHFLDKLVNLVSANDADDLSDSDWDECNYVRPPIPKLIQDQEMDDLNIADMDIQFSQDDIIRMLNLPPTAKILPPENREDTKLLPVITEIIEEQGETSYDKIKTERRISKCIQNKAFDLNANITNKAISDSQKQEVVHHISIPNLKSLYKCPPVIWQQSESLICLNIFAPDVEDYYLKVTSKYIIFISKIQDERKMVALNFCGCVTASLVSHEIRGLNVIVRLPKAIKGIPWPRLTLDADKPGWLKYNYESIKVEQQTLKNTARFPVQHYVMDDSSSGLSDSDVLDYDTRANDIFDPFDDDFN